MPRISRLPIVGLMLIALSVPAAAPACELSAADPPIETKRPVRGEDVRLTSGFGMRLHPVLNLASMHTGVDWAAPIGSLVIAAGPGRVISAEEAGEYGNRIIIDHGNSWQSLYAKLDTFTVRVGDCVQTGTPIGTVGMTGLTSGPHLHFEVLAEGKPIDPLLLRTKAKSN